MFMHNYNSNSLVFHELYTSDKDILQIIEKKKKRKYRKEYLTLTRFDLLCYAAHL